MIYTKLYRAKSRVIETLVRTGLVKFVDHDKTSDERVFAKDNSPRLSVNGRLAVEDRVSNVEGNLWHHYKINLTARTWVSDNAAHFTNRVLRKVTAALRIHCHFSVADSARTNGTVKRMMHEVLRVLQGTLAERGNSLENRITVVSAMQ